jgi:large subunit ribosomal protein L25
VPVHLEGEAPGTRDGGMLEQLVFTLTIEAKPADIPNEIVVDVSGLELGGQLRIAELTVPAGVAVQQDADELVVQVVLPRVAEVEEEAAEEGEEAAAEDEGAPAEGEAPAAESGGEPAE